MLKIKICLYNKNWHQKLRSLICDQVMSFVFSCSVHHPSTLQKKNFMFYRFQVDFSETRQLLNSRIWTRVCLSSTFCILHYRPSIPLLVRWEGFAMRTVHPKQPYERACTKIWINHEDCFPFLEIKLLFLQYILVMLFPTHILQSTPWSLLKNFKNPKILSVQA